MDFPSGAIAPVPTPLDAALVFDQEAQATHLKWLASEGLDGALILGTNGEFPSFSLNERRAVAEAAVAADSGLDLILGVGSCALPDVLTMVDLASSLGYRAVLCPPPFYVRSAPATGIAAFFLEILERSSLPVLLYHIPQVTGVAVSDEVLDLLAKALTKQDLNFAIASKDQLNNICQQQIEQILINDHIIGGFDELCALDKDGDLERLLGA